MKNKNPLIDIAAILMCMLPVVLVGQYYIHKKAVGNNSLHQIEKCVELKEDKKQPFESLVKITEIE